MAIDYNKCWRDAVGDPVVVVINGIGGCGKDTFVGMVKQVSIPIHDPTNLSNHLTCVVENVSTIDPIKRAAITVGWDFDKSDRGRKFLSDFKKLVKNYNDFTYHYCEDVIKEGQHKILFIHCREPEEIDRFVKDFGAKTLLIRRSGVDIPTNDSDMAVENYSYDYVINNNGTIKDLEEQAVKFMKWLGCDTWIDRGVSVA